MPEGYSIDMLNINNKIIHKSKDTVKTGIIYRAVCTVNGKSYVGQTTKKMLKRRQQHISSHKNIGDCIFHKAIKKYGAHNFIWGTLHDNIPESELSQWEAHYIKKYNTFIDDGMGYNMIKYTPRPVYSQQSRDKISKALKGKRFTENHKRKISQGLKKPETQKIKSKLTTEINKLRWQDPEYKKRTGAAISKALTGKKLAPETCYNMSKAKKGVPLSVAHRESCKIAQNRPEVKKRNSESVKKAYRDNPELRDNMSRAIKKAHRDDPSYRYKLSRSGTIAQNRPDVKEKHRIASTGKKHTQESKDKISNAHKGKKKSAQARANMRSGWARRRQQQHDRTQLGLLI